MALCGATVSCGNNIDFGYQPGKHVCSVEDCGGNATTISGAVTIAALKNASGNAAKDWLMAGHSLVVSVCKGGDCLDDETIRVNAVSSCSNEIDGVHSCASLKASGEACDGKTGPTDSASFLCLGVTSQGTRWPKVDGDQFSLSMQDEAGTTLVQELLVAHYDHVTPANCDNVQHVECTNGAMFF